MILDIVMSYHYKTEPEICTVSVYISQADKWSYNGVFIHKAPTAQYKLKRLLNTNQNIGKI